METVIQATFLKMDKEIVNNKVSKVFLKIEALNINEANGAQDYSQIIIFYVNKLEVKTFYEIKGFFEGNEIENEDNVAILFFNITEKIKIKDNKAMKERDIVNKSALRV